MNTEKLRILLHRQGEKGRKPLLAILLVSLISLTGYWVYQSYGDKGRIIEASGTIEATTLNVTAKVAGTVENMEIRSGDKIKKGQLLAAISRNDLAAQKERDELSVIKAEAALADLVSGARAQEIKDALANVNIAAVNYRQAADELERAKVLFENGALAQVEYERAERAAEIARHRLAAAEASLSLAEEGTRAELVKAAEIEVARNKAVLKATEALLADLQIIAPMDGIVLSKNYEEGEYLQAGATLLTLAKTDELWIRVFIPTDDLPYITLGQQVQFTVSGYKDTFMGVIEEIAAKGEFTPKTIQTKKERANVVFAVKIRTDSAGGILKPGMPADIVIMRGPGQ